MDYKVKIDVFDGPFDLLLHLVRIHEMDIYDISIAKITKQYLDFIDEMQDMDLEVTGDFLVMAASLINIKSRALMPLEKDTDEEEEEELDQDMADIHSAQDLMRRLIEYREFKELAGNLAQNQQEELKLFYRNSVLPKIENEEPELREDINLLFSAFARVLDIADGRPIHHVTDEEYHVEEKIESIKNQLNLQQRLSVQALFERCANKQEMITVFLALLEICRMSFARLRQSDNFKEIMLVLPNEAEEDDDE